MAVPGLRPRPVACAAASSKTTPSPPRTSWCSPTRRASCARATPSSSPSRCPTRRTSPCAARCSSPSTEALNNQSADKLLGNTKPEQDFDIPAKESRSLRLAHPRARRLRFPHLQGRRRGGQRVRRRGRLSAGALPPHPGHRVAAAADSRPGDEEVRVHQAAQVGQLEDAPEPEPGRADGVQPGVVCGAGAALPDGISLRVHRADLQPALRQCPGAHHRQQRPEDPAHLRPVEEHPRARKPACRRTRTSRR